MRVPKMAAAALLALAVSSRCSSSGGSSSGSAASAAPPARGAPASPGDPSKPSSPVLELASMLTGRFRGSTPGNDMAVVLTGTFSGSSDSIYDVIMRVTGTYRDAPVREQGVMHLQSQGRGVLLQYIPHFDATVGILTTDALRFSPAEADAACNFDVVPRGDGYFGETVGASTCARAIHGAVGKWTFEVEMGSVRIRNSGTGETLRFKRVE